MKLIELKNAKVKRYNGIFNYLIAYDYAAGRKNRYTLMILTSSNPIVAGRELDLKTIRELIGEYEAEAKKLTQWTGYYKSVEGVIHRALRRRMLRSK